jgi:hypothetical protein
MLMGREELSDRIVGLVGHRQVSLTTRTMEEIGQRISRYLATFALVNSGFGLIIGLGLWLIGAPFAVLWGCLAAMLRFIPYVGPAVSFILPLVFSFAHFPGWAKPLEIVVLFAVVEATLTSFLEPVIYGKTTGVSALGLLIAAMFWTWLWGSMGLLLSTPLTVCLAVLGKYVPSLWFFTALLKEDINLEPDIRFYQRLLARDREGAIEIVNAALKQRPRVEVFDDILIAALARSEDDVARDQLDGTMQAFVWGVVGEVIDSLEGVPDLSLTAMAMPAAGGAGTEGEVSASQPVVILGLVADDNSDALALRMLKHRILVAGRRASRRTVPFHRDHLVSASRGIGVRSLPDSEIKSELLRPTHRCRSVGRKCVREFPGTADGRWGIACGHFLGGRTRSYSPRAQTKRAYRQPCQHALVCGKRLTCSQVESDEQDHRYISDGRMTSFKQRPILSSDIWGARSAKATIPTSWPAASMTRSRWTLCCPNSALTSSKDASGKTEMISLLIRSDTAMLPRSGLLATAKATSRSVRIPIARPASTTGTAPQSASRKSRLASNMELKAEHVRGLTVITSATVRFMGLGSNIEGWLRNLCGWTFMRGSRAVGRGPLKW